MSTLNPKYPYELQMSNQEYKHPLPSPLKSYINTIGDLHKKDTLIING